MSDPTPGESPSAATTATIPSESRIVIRQLERIFASRHSEVKALGPLDLEIREGEFVCVVGPSGCGKSTLVRLLGGLVRPSRGEIQIAHRDPARHLVSIVFQNQSVFPWQTVERNMRAPLDIGTRLSKAEKAERVEYWLHRMDLTAFAKAYPATLSGGMRQRVAIARALILDPEVIIMDEPFASLDAQLRSIMQDELIQLWERDRRTVVFVTHALDEAILLGDRLIIMSARPGLVRADIRVPFERPRTSELRGTPEFADLVQQTWDTLRLEVLAQVSADDSNG